MSDNLRFRHQVKLTLKPLHEACTLCQFHHMHHSQRTDARELTRTKLLPLQAEDQVLAALANLPHPLPQHAPTPPLLQHDH